MIQFFLLLGVILYWTFFLAFLFSSYPTYYGTILGLVSWFICMMVVDKLWKEEFGVGMWRDKE